MDANARALAAGRKHCNRYTVVLVSAFTTQQQDLVGLDVWRELVHKSLRKEDSVQFPKLTVIIY